MEPLVYKLTEVAKMLGISKSLAYELAAKGTIPVLRLGEKRLVVPKLAFENLLNDSVRNADTSEHNNQINL